MNDKIFRPQLPLTSKALGLTEYGWELAKETLLRYGEVESRDESH